MVSCMLTVSVVIPSLNSPMIDQVVDRVRAQSYPPLEIIVVGRDRDRRLAGRTDVCFVDTGRPVSPSAARNAGARRAIGDVLCFLDADCLAAEDWIARMVERQATGAPVVCGGVRLPPGGYWRLCDNLAALAEFIDVNAPGERFHMASLNFSIAAASFRAIGGFDESFSRAGEDTDLSFRLRRAGYTIVFEPRASVAHYTSRADAAAAWRHLHAFGSCYPAVWGKHAAALGRSQRLELCRHRPRLALALAPALAALDSLQFYTRHPALARYWYALPGVIWARTGWYMGVIGSGAGGRVTG